MPLLTLFPDTVNLYVRIPITDADLIHLQGLKSLSSLGFANCPEIRGDGLKYLVGLKKLQSLDITNTNVGDNGLGHRRRVDQLAVRLSWGEGDQPRPGTSQAA